MTTSALLFLYALNDSLFYVATPIMFRLASLFDRRDLPFLLLPHLVLAILVTLLSALIVLGLGVEGRERSLRKGLVTTLAALVPAVALSINLYLDQFLRSPVPAALVVVLLFVMWPLALQWSGLWALKRADWKLLCLFAAPLFILLIVAASGPGPVGDLAPWEAWYVRLLLTLEFVVAAYLIWAMPGRRRIATIGAAGLALIWTFGAYARAFGLWCCL